MTPSERLSLAIHQESAAIAPQTSELIEAAKVVRDENVRLRSALMQVRDMKPEDMYVADGCGYHSAAGMVADHALTQQLIPGSE